MDNVDNFVENYYLQPIREAGIQQNRGLSGFLVVRGGITYVNG